MLNLFRQIKKEKEYLPFEQRMIRNVLIFVAFIVLIILFSNILSDVVSGFTYRNTCSVDRLKIGDKIFYDGKVRKIEEVKNWSWGSFQLEFEN